VYSWLDVIYIFIKKSYQSRKFLNPTSHSAKLQMSAIFSLARYLLIVIDADFYHHLWAVCIS
jgi:hypothetical protein